MIKVTFDTHVCSDMHVYAAAQSTLLWPSSSLAGVMAAALRRSHSWMTGDMSSSHATISKVDRVGCHCIEEHLRSRLYTPHKSLWLYSLLVASGIGIRAVPD